MLPIDRERFLWLATVLASARCGPAPAQRATPAANVPVATGAAPASQLPLDAQHPPSPAPTSPICSLDLGHVDCAKIDAVGPTCEAFDDCHALKDGSYGYKPRVAQAIVACWDRLGKKACVDYEARSRCLRQAVLGAGCPDPRFEATCEATLHQCRSQGLYVDYKVEDCVAVLSALTDAERDTWADEMGPRRNFEESSTLSCKLAFPPP